MLSKIRANSLWVTTFISGDAPQLEFAIGVIYTASGLSIRLVIHKTRFASTRVIKVPIKRESSLGKSTWLMHDTLAYPIQ